MTILCQGNMMLTWGTLPFEKGVLLHELLKIHNHTLISQLYYRTRIYMLINDII